MKTLKKDKEIVRKHDDEASKLVKNGWSYCKKEEWKKIRAVEKKAVKEEPKEIKEIKSSGKESKKNKENYSKYKAKKDIQ